MTASHPREPSIGTAPPEIGAATGGGSAARWGAIAGLCLLAGVGWMARAELAPWLKPLLPWSTAAPTKPQQRPTPVVTATARKRDVDFALNGLGTVTAFKTVTVKSRVEGELVRVAFTEGQIVQEGELLAEIDPRPFQVQLEQAEGQLIRDEATLAAAIATLNRYQDLAKRKTITGQEIDDQTALVRQTEGIIRTDRALVENAKLQLSYCQITAPITGRAGLRLVDQGNMIRANDLSGLVVITQLQPIALLFTIPQDEIADVQRRLSERTLAVHAYDRDFKRKLAEGQLLAVDNQVDPTTGTVRLKAVFANEDQVLFPNQFVNAKLLVRTLPDAVVIPTAAIQRGQQGPYVYVVVPDDAPATATPAAGPTGANGSPATGGPPASTEKVAAAVSSGSGQAKPAAAGQPANNDAGGKSDKPAEPPRKVELRLVTPGFVDGVETVIDAGLQAGEVVVTEGLDKLQHGSKIQVRTKDAPGKGKPGERSEAGSTGGPGRPSGAGGEPPKGPGAVELQPSPDEPRRGPSSDRPSQEPATGIKHGTKPIDPRNGEPAKAPQSSAVPHCAHSNAGMWA